MHFNSVIFGFVVVLLGAPGKCSKKDVFAEKGTNEILVWNSNEFVPKKNAEGRYTPFKDETTVM